MAVLERQTQKPRFKEPTFSSSLLDTIYRSIDETAAKNERREVEKDIESLRRSIMIEKWIENHNKGKTKSTPRHFPSNSASSSDSSTFSSTETESSTSKSTPKSSHKTKKNNARNPPLEKLLPPVKILHIDTKPNKCDEKSATTTKSRAHKIYGDLKVKLEPISPGGKISSFLNSVFSPRNMKPNRGSQEWSSTVMKSLSVNDAKMSCSLATTSCLSKNQFSRGKNINNNKNNNTNKSKRSVRFCPVSTVIVDKNCQPDGQKSTIYRDEYSTSSPTIGSQYIKKNIDSFRVYEAKNTRYYHHHHQKKNENRDLDDMSCASSDLFELENIRAHEEEEEEELPVYGTTSVKVNQTIGVGKKWHF